MNPLKKHIIPLLDAVSRFKNTSMRKHPWAVWVVGVLLIVGMFSNFLSNDKPLWCTLEGKHYFPAAKEMMVNLGVATWTNAERFRSWKKEKYEAVIWPPVPYKATELDMRNSNYVSPFGAQRVASWRWRHWLGTDKIGRDVLAGLISGTRIVLLAGLIAMSIALLIGISLGSLAGYFGNTGVRMNGMRIFLNVVAVFPAVFYGIIARPYLFPNLRSPLWGIVFSCLMIIALFLVLNIFISWLERNLPPRRTYAIPIDDLIMRFIEIINSIPGLLLLLSMVAILKERNIFSIMLIIGIISWTGIARFVRAELLRIRQLEYIDAARVMGFGHWRILTRHALPNAMKPVTIAVAFGIAGAVLLEASLSFLGIGDTGDAVSWGQLLNYARQQHDAWWLAVFPGLAISLTVLSFNLIGESLSDR